MVLVEPEEIDRLNILPGHDDRHEPRRCRPVAGAPRGADRRQQLPRDLPCPGRAIIGGDALEPAISAASILAKVSRDRLMVALDAMHPGYGFAVHKGYPDACPPERLAAARPLCTASPELCAGAAHAGARVYSVIDARFRLVIRAGDDVAHKSLQLLRDRRHPNLQGVRF